MSSVLAGPRVDKDRYWTERYLRCIQRRISRISTAGHVSLCTKLQGGAPKRLRKLRKREKQLKHTLNRYDQGGFVA